MPHSNQGSVASQVESLQRQFAQAPGLPFADLLPAELIMQLLQEQDVEFHERLYTPVVTLAMLLSQCQDADPSQRQAVARVIAQRVAQGQSACSSNTGAYSKARQRLPAKLLVDLTRHTGKQLMTEAPAGWSWHGRDVKIVGSVLISCWLICRAVARPARLFYARLASSSSRFKLQGSVVSPAAFAGVDFSVM